MSGQMRLQTAILLGLISISLHLSGCACQRRQTNCASNQVNDLPRTQQTRLPEIELDTRPRWHYELEDEFVEGMPVLDLGFSSSLPMELPSSPLVQDLGAEIASEELRAVELTAAETVRLASINATIANRIDNHRAWLGTLPLTPLPVLTAMNAQSDFERSQHVSQSLEAMIGLMRVHAQVAIAAQSIALIDDSQNVLGKFAAAGVEIAGDRTELDRQKIEIDQKLTEAKYQQQKLEDGLAVLLELYPDSLPIWVAYEEDLNFKKPVPDIDQAVAQAWQNRGDLKALEILAENAHCLSLETLRATSAGGGVGGGVISPGIDLPGPARWWQCILKNQIECLKQKAQAERKRQLRELAESKRQQIRLEVRNAIGEIEKLSRLIDLKQQQLRSLSESIEGAERAKDLRPVDFESHLRQHAKRLELRAEIIDDRLKLEASHYQLQHLMGKSITILPR